MAAYWLEDRVMDLVDLYFFDDPGAVDNEFGFVLERPLLPRRRGAVRGIRSSRASRVLERPTRDARRLVACTRRC